MPILPLCRRCGCCSLRRDETCVGPCDADGSHILSEAEDRLSFLELRTASQERLESGIFGHDEWPPERWGLAAAGELGEGCNKLKKILRGDRGVTAKDVAHELADTVIYLDHWAQSMGIDLGRAVREKFNLVSDRVGSEVKL